MNMLKIVAVPMHKEGRKFVAIFAGISIALLFVWAPLFWLGVGATVWCYYFFRDPVRVIPQQQGLVLSPADGIISLIEEVVPTGQSRARAIEWAKRAEKQSRTSGVSVTPAK